jgi:general secretion pathway protein I
VIKYVKNNFIAANKFRSGGFTLLEILVALAIFALVSVTCYRQIDASFRASTRIEQKYLALWVAESALDEKFVERQWPMTGETISEYEISNSRWVVKMNISEMDIKTLRRVDVSVYTGEKDDDHAILTLTRFVGEN